MIEDVDTAPTPPAPPPALPPAPGPLGPVTEPERIAALDVLRGFAIFGIFMVNMQFFAMPLMDLLVPAPAGDVAAAERVSWSVVKAFFEYKFISIFSLLFGMGMVVQMRRAEARGRPFAPLYLRRTFVLMGLGLAHGLLLWYGDILFMYSWAALLLFALRRLQARLLLVLALAAVLLAVGIVGCFGAMGVISQQWQTVPAPAAAEKGAPEGSEEPDAAMTDPQPGEVDDEVAPVESEDQLAPAEDEAAADDRPWSRLTRAMQRAAAEPESDAWREIEVIAYKEGPWLGALLVRSITFGIILLMVTFGGFGFRIVGMFFLGAALMKLDFFAQKRRRWHWVLCLGGLPLGVSGELLTVWLLFSAGETFGWRMALSDPIHQLASLALCLGYVGAITLVVSGGLLRPFSIAMAAVGRMALSNYLLQTVVATFLMYGWGLGWFGDVSRPRQIALVCVIFGGQILASLLWLRVFSIGPFEWLWRSLTYLRMQPVLRRRKGTKGLRD
ncbi:MAG: DUF418 domain-containing protein [Planctomycetota bacterium]|jgi:uncharacterized protein